MNEPGFQPDGFVFQADAFQVDYDETQFVLTEGRDVAAFTIDVETQAQFNIIELPDVAAFTITSTTFVTFNLTEQPDVAAFTTTSTTQAQFNLVERPDVTNFLILTGARFSFALTELPDVANFRTFATWWDLGDTYYVHVPYENKTILVPSDFTEYRTPYIVVQPEDQTIYIRDERQVIQVDQSRGSRSEI